MPHKLLAILTVLVSVFTFGSLANANTEYVLDIQVKRNGSVIWAFSSPVVDHQRFGASQSADLAAVREVFVANPKHAPVDSGVDVRGAFLGASDSDVKTGQFHWYVEQVLGYNPLLGDNAEPDKAVVEFSTMETLEVGKPVRREVLWNSNVSSFTIDLLLRHANQ
tara:strand:+ start:5844 stop:6338 length:495 start_codon:yes stop_codon:yes gene_type:complete